MYFTKFISNTFIFTALCCLGISQSLASNNLQLANNQRAHTSFIQLGKPSRNEVPIINTLQTELPDNLRVTFILNDISNEIVEGNGVPMGTWVSWYATSPEVTIERIPSAIHHPVPDVGQLYSTQVYNTIYDGIIVDGCDSTPTITIDFESWIREKFSEESTILGTFNEINENTIQRNGYWNFSYVIRISEYSENVSDIRISGIANATCTNLEDFNNLDANAHRAKNLTNNPKLEKTIRNFSVVNPSDRELGFTTIGDDTNPYLHCDGNTNYSCAKYISACSSFGGTPNCIPVQTPGGGTNGSVCDCGVDW